MTRGSSNALHLMFVALVKLIFFCDDIWRHSGLQQQN